MPEPQVSEATAPAPVSSPVDDQPTTKAPSEASVDAFAEAMAGGPNADRPQATSSNDGQNGADTGSAQGGSIAAHAAADDSDSSGQANQSHSDDSRLRGPELGRRSVEKMVETRDRMDRTADILDNPPDGIPDIGRAGKGVAGAINQAANDGAINSVNKTADQMARNELSKQAQRAGLSQDEADDYASSVVDDAKDIRAANPDLTAREIAERAVARNGSAFGDPSVDARQNEPGENNGVKGDDSDSNPHDGSAYSDRPDRAPAPGTTQSNNEPGENNGADIGDDSDSNPNDGSAYSDRPDRSPSSGSSGDSGGGNGNERVICTYFYQKGDLARGDWAADLRFTQQRISEQTVRGYHAWAIPTVRLMRSESLASRIIEPMMRFVTVHRARELAYQMGRREHGDVIGKMIRYTIEPLCWSIGAFVGAQDWRSLYTPMSIRSGG